MCLHFSPPGSPEKVGPEFVLEVEVYCSVPADDPPSSKPSTPIKMLRKFSKSKVTIHIAHFCKSKVTIHIAHSCNQRETMQGTRPLYVNDLCNSQWVGMYDMIAT